MAIVCISPLSGCPGDELAAEVARRLGAGLVGEDIWQLAAGTSGRPRERLRRALESPSSFLGMSLGDRQFCLAHLQAALTKRLLAEPAVYVFPFGHHLVQGVSHLLKVRLSASVEWRAAALAQKQNSEAARTIKEIKKHDRLRNDLSLLLFGVDDGNDLFDLVLDCAQVALEQAAQLVLQTAGQPRYRKASYSQQTMEDLALACQVRAAIAGDDPQAEVTSSGGMVRIKTRLEGRLAKKKIDGIRLSAEKTEGVVAVEIQRLGDLSSRTARPLR